MEHGGSIEELTRRNVALVDDMEKDAAGRHDPSDHAAARIAAWIGSWWFVGAQTAMLTLWIGLNVAARAWQWDPYPFDLLNMVLACLAAYTAPILLISQNLQSRLAERRNRLDLQVNLLAEQETTEILRLLRLLCQHAAIAPDGVDCTPSLAEDTRPDEIARQIDEEGGDTPPACG